MYGRSTIRNKKRDFSIVKFIHSNDDTRKSHNQSHKASRSIPFFGWCTPSHGSRFTARGSNAYFNQPLEGNQAPKFAQPPTPNAWEDSTVLCVASVHRWSSHLTKPVERQCFYLINYLFHTRKKRCACNATNNSYLHVKYLLPKSPYLAI